MKKAYVSPKAKVIILKNRCVLMHTTSVEKKHEPYNSEEYNII